MNDILQDISPSSISQAMDANEIEFSALLGTLPSAEFHQDPDLCWVETGVPDAQFNAVLQIRSTPEMLPTTIDRAISHFRQRHLSFHWRLGPTSQPANFGDLLQARGLSYNETEPGMAVDLLKLNENLSLASNLTISPVVHDELLHQWIRAWGCGGTPEEVIQHWFTVYSQLPVGPQSNLRMYIGSIDEKPVATVALFLGGGVAAIHHVVTIPEFRRRGIGAAMTLMAAREARSAGYRVAVLTASPFGINIYRHLGFKEYCEVSTYCSDLLHLNLPEIL